MCTRSHTLLLRLIAFVAIVTPAGAQGRFERVIDPFVVEDRAGEKLSSPFSGGLGSARIGLVDVSGDLLPDLLALNPDGRLRAYRNTGEGRFVRTYPSPYDSAPVFQWFRLADINDDGALDLFSGGSHSEVLLYANLGTTAEPAWGAADTVRADTIIFTQLETVPSLVDIDGDGDLDLFSGNIEGSITFYRNVGNASNPAFELASTRFQDILVISSTARRKRADEPRLLHGASVLDFADMDGDGDLDLLFGDFFTTRLLYFTNDGSRQSPSFSMGHLDTAFRGFGDDVESYGFNQPAAGDIDGDGDVDIIVSSLYPNSALEALTPYVNEGSPTMPAMRRRQGGITGELDLGTYAAPCTVADTRGRSVLVGNGDGVLTEYSVTVDGARTRMARMGVHAPLTGRFNASPTSGDLDGDGVSEVVVGSADEGNLKLLKRVGSEFVVTPWLMDTATVGRYASPALVDLDRDGDLDLLVGAAGGRILYFENRGTPQHEDFVATPPPPPFDTLDVGAYSAPFADDIDGDGDIDVLIGGRTNPTDRVGRVRFWINDGVRFDESPAYPPLLAGTQPKPMVARLTEGLFVLVGEQSGGITAWRDSGTTSNIPINPSRARGPSFRREGEFLLLEGNFSPEGASLGLFDVTGREVFRGQIEGSRIKVPDLPIGRYLVDIGRRSAGSIVIVR